MASLSPQTPHSLSSRLPLALAAALGLAGAVLAVQRRRSIPRTSSWLKQASRGQPFLRGVLMNAGRSLVALAVQQLGKEGLERLLGVGRKRLAQSSTEANFRGEQIGPISDRTRMSAPV